MISIIQTSKCFHLNCEIRELSDKNILDVATVAFNNCEVVRWQIKLIRKNVLDKNFYTGFDNSSDDTKSDEIRKVCEEENAAYVKLPKNDLTRSSSHGSSLNWIYRNYFKRGAHDTLAFSTTVYFPLQKPAL